MTRRLFHIACKKQLIFLVFLLLSLPPLAQEVPGTVIFRKAPAEGTQPNMQTPFRKPSIEEPKAPERPIIPKVNSPVVPGGDALKDAQEKPEEPNRRPLASQRRPVLPPEGMEPKDVVEQKKTMPEGRKPLDLTESSPVVFAQSDIAISTWRPEEEYFEDDPTKTTFLKASIKRAEAIDGLQQAGNAATLTIFPQLQLAVIPLANSFSAQDILFLDDGGVIRQMVYKTEPQSPKGVVSKQEVRSVLQMPSGSIKRYSIKIGDKVAIPPR